jgi:hypothetical protein
MFMSMPNGPQANPQFPQAKAYNFGNSGTAPTGYEEQTKAEYTNYNPQAQQLKNTSSGAVTSLNNVVNELNTVSNFQKSVTDKTNAGYHTPSPNYSSSLVNQAHVGGPSANTGQPQYAYMISGTAGANTLVHSGIQVKF